MLINDKGKAALGTVGGAEASKKGSGEAGCGGDDDHLLYWCGLPGLGLVNFAPIFLVLVGLGLLQPGKPRRRLGLELLHSLSLGLSVAEPGESPRPGRVVVKQKEEELRHRGRSGQGSRGAASAASAEHLSSPSPLP